MRPTVTARPSVFNRFTTSMPAVVAGIAATDVGLHETTAVYNAAVIGFCALALLAQPIRTGRAQVLGAARD